MNVHKTTPLIAKFRIFFWLVTGVWTACVVGSLLWNLQLQANHIVQLARRSAQITFEDDMLYRRWTAKQGGVYVRISEDTPPNPYLLVPDRDVVTTSGMHLTLVNPAYMARQVHALVGEAGSSREHLTSLKPLRPENAPDAWEAAALESFEQGVAEVSSLEQMAGGEHLRLMRPFIVEQDCLICHAVQGYKVGDVRGGVSVSVPMAPLRAIEKPMSVHLALAHLGLWLVGLVGSGILRRSLVRQLFARQRAETEREKFVSLADQSSEFIAMCDMKFQPLYVNEAGQQLMGLDSLEQARVTPVREFFFPEDQRFISKEFFPRVLREGRGEVEIRFRHFKSGEPLWMSCNFFHIRDAGGKPAQLATVSRNITQRKQAEERLRSSLGEKEVLLKEIHHRVKNNMQVISSLVALQAQRLPDAATRAVLQDVTHRVRSMALVHEKLYQSADMTRVEFAEYVRSLMTYLWCAHGTAASGIRPVLDLEPVHLSVDLAVPCALVLNELVSNSLKHAFRGRVTPGCGNEVAVSLRGSLEGQVCLCVRDNGVGLPPEFDWRQADSLGLQLVQMLAGQLHAAVEVVTRAGEGTEFKVLFERESSCVKGSSKEAVISPQ